MKVDVVVAVLEKAPVSLDAAYQVGSTALGRVIAVCDEPAGAVRLREVRGHRADLIVLQNETKLGRIASWNRGLFLCGRDVLLLDSDVTLGEGSLEEMLEVLHSSDRIASVAPLASDAALGMDLGGVPRCTDVPTARGSCLLVRHVVVNMIGGFDPAFERANDAQDDWTMRAQRMGLRHVRANRALALRDDASCADVGPAHTALLFARHPHFPEEAKAGQLGAEPHATAHFVASRRGPPRVTTAVPRDGEPLEHSQVLYRSEPVDDAGQLLALLESPYHLVLAESGANRNPALLFAATHSAQAVVTGSETERATLIADLALDPATVEVVESPAGLTSVFHKVVDHPSESSLRYRALLANFLRSLREGAAAPLAEEDVRGR